MIVFGLRTHPAVGSCWRRSVGSVSMFNKLLLKSSRLIRSVPGAVGSAGGDAWHTSVLVSVPQKVCSEDPDRLKLKADFRRWRWASEADRLWKRWPLSRGKPEDVRSVAPDSQTRGCCVLSEQHEGSACACRLLLRPSCQVLHVCQCLGCSCVLCLPTALPCGWERHGPSMRPWIRWKSSLHFNELVNNPEDCWGVLVYLEFGCIVITPTALAGQAVFLFFFSRIPSGQEAFYPQLWFRLRFCGGGFFIQGESIIFSPFLKGKVSIMKSLSAPLRNPIPVYCGSPEAAIPGSNSG